MTDRVWVVTTTFNRIQMLQQCLNAVRAQTAQVAGIVVTDNGSTDETAATLATMRDVQTVRQRNLGSAGGFVAGMVAALARECDWLWLMDDDVLAAPDALAELLRATRARPDARVFNSFCVGADNRERPSAGALSWRSDPNNYLQGEYLYTSAQVRRRADAAGLLDSAGGQFFLGTLVHRTVVEKLGLPLGWLFTRGDEIEYGLRIMRAGYHILTATRSVVTHPDTPIVYMNVFGKRLPFEQMSPVKRYYSMRNSIYVRHAYYAGYPLLPYIARRLVGTLLTEWVASNQKSFQQKLAGTRAALRGVRDGWRSISQPSVALNQELYGI